MKVLIMGGGIIGVTTAYYLALGGDNVTVIDRQRGVALETSFANAGLVSPGHSYSWASPRAPGILLRSLVSKGQPLRLRLRTDWRGYTWCWQFLRNCTSERAYRNTSIKARLSRYSQEQLASLTSRENLCYEQNDGGLLYLYRDNESFENGVARSTVLTEGGLKLERLDRAATIAREPALADSRNDLAGSIYCPSDATGDAHLFTKAVSACCTRLGVTFMFNTQVLGISGDAAQVDYVETTGGRMSADCYVLALGSYSPQLARRLGYRLPVYPVKGYSMTFPIPNGAHAPAIGGVDEAHLLAWARFGTRLRITAGAEFAGYNSRFAPGDFDPMLRAVRELFPHSADYSQPTYWAGLRPMTPEGTPYIGRTRHHNLFFNTGHGHLGWTWSCGTARLLADIMHSRVPEIDLTGLTLATKNAQGARLYGSPR